MSTEKSYAPGEHPDMAPPSTEVGIIGWIRHNLFSSTTNIVITVLTMYLLYIIVPPLLNWIFFDAVFSAESRDDCRAIAKAAGEELGACWAFIGKRFEIFVYGFYPVEERWRVDISFIMMLAALVPVLFDNVPGRKQALWFSLAAPFIIGWLLIGGLGLTPVSTDKFGGFMLTLTIGVTGIVGSLPIGIALALGRQSHMPALRMVCVAFIEFIHPRCAADYLAVCRLDHVELLPATGNDLRPAVARIDYGNAVFLGLYSRGYKGRFTGITQRADRSRRLDGIEVLAIDATDYSATGVEDFDPGDREYLYRPV
jgi:general L-amino acid transport system permease protein